MDAWSGIDFSRDPGPLAVCGIRAGNLRELRGELERAGLEGAWVVSDLSLGAWRGHQVAAEFLSQLELTPVHAAAPTPGWENADRRTEMPYADIIGAFIDAEAGGDRTTIESLALASRIRNWVLDDPPRVFVVIAPRACIPWEQENTLFIRILAQALRGTRCALALVATEGRDPEVPTDWRVEWRGEANVQPEPEERDGTELIPGVLGPELQPIFGAGHLARQGRIVSLAHGFLLIPPECRRHPRDVPPLEFDRLGVLARSHGWLDAYAQFHGNTIYVEPWLLYTEALRRFAEGGSGITLRLIERALECVQPGPEWGILQSYAQGLRVALHRFAEAASMDDPPATVGAELRGFLLQAKGWGLVMIGDLPHAEQCLRQSRALMEPIGRDRREYLYLLNISALCRLKSGDIESALVLEHEIEVRKKVIFPQDRRLDYVNSINLGRLYRRRGDFETGEHYFLAAFATTYGARSESDAIYANVIQAKLHADCGRNRQSFACWMRAGLHWAASDAPEAMGRRVSRSIIGEKSELMECLPEAIAAALSASILAAAATSGIASVASRATNPEMDSCPAPIFARTAAVHGRAPHTPIDRAALGVGFSVLATQKETAPQILGNGSMRLRALLFALLETLAPAGFFLGTKTIVVDDSFGREIPATPEELLNLCVRLAVERVAIDGEVIKLDATARVAMENNLRVRLGSAVERIARYDEQVVILFKRCLRPAVLAPEESHVLALLEDEPTIGDLRQRSDKIGPPECVLPMLRRLERLHVVNIDLLAPVHWTAGASGTIWSDISATCRR